MNFNNFRNQWNNDINLYNRTKYINNWINNEITYGLNSGENITINNDNKNYRLGKSIYYNNTDQCQIQKRNYLPVYLKHSDYPWIVNRNFEDPLFNQNNEYKCCKKNNINKNNSRLLDVYLKTNRNTGRESYILSDDIDLCRILKNYHVKEDYLHDYINKNYLPIIINILKDHNGNYRNDWFYNDINNRILNNVNKMIMYKICLEIYNIMNGRLIYFEECVCRGDPTHDTMNVNLRFIREQMDNEVFNILIGQDDFRIEIINFYEYLEDKLLDINNLIILINIMEQYLTISNDKTTDLYQIFIISLNNISNKHPNISILDIYDGIDINYNQINYDKLYQLYNNIDKTYPYLENFYYNNQFNDEYIKNKLLELQVLQNNWNNKINQLNINNSITMNFSIFRDKEYNIINTIFKIYKLYELEYDDIKDKLNQKYIELVVLLKDDLRNYFKIIFKILNRYSSYNYNQLDIYKLLNKFIIDYLYNIDNISICKIIDNTINNAIGTFSDNVIECIINMINLVKQLYIYDENNKLIKKETVIEDILLFNDKIIYLDVYNIDNIINLSIQINKELDEKIQINKELDEKIQINKDKELDEKIQKDILKLLIIYLIKKINIDNNIDIIDNLEELYNKYKVGNIQLLANILIPYSRYYIDKNNNINSIIDKLIAIFCHYNITNKDKCINYNSNTSIYDDNLIYIYSLLLKYIRKNNKIEEKKEQLVDDLLNDYNIYRNRKIEEKKRKIEEQNEDENIKKKEKR